MVAFKTDGIVVVTAVGIETEPAREDDGVTAACQGRAIRQAAASQNDTAVAAAVDDVIANSGQDAIVAEPAIEDVIVEPAVDDVIADAANQNVGGTACTATTTPNRIADQDQPGPVEGNVSAIGLRARIEDLRCDVAGITRGRVVLVDRDKAIANQPGGSNVAGIGRGMEYRSSRLQRHTARRETA